MTKLMMIRPGGNTELHCRPETAGEIIASVSVNETLENINLISRKKKKN